MMVSSMKKYIISVIVVLLLTGSLFSISLAWFTYVKRKSVATFVSNEILVDLEVNDDVQINDYVLNDLAFIDFQNDFIEDQNGLFNTMASSIYINIQLSENSPLTKHHIQITNLNTEGLLVFVIYEGTNITLDHVFESNYQVLLMQIIEGYLMKTDMVLAINAYNAAVLEYISNILIYPGDEIVIQIAIWGDYDGLTDQEGYLEQSFFLNLSIESINARGVS